jgi:dihydroorotate dehydrogenase
LRTPRRSSRRALTSSPSTELAERHDDHDLAYVIRQLHTEFGAVVLADVGTLAEGIAAATCGADAVATTLAGLTGEPRHQDGPALDVVAALAARLDLPVIAEGGITSPAQVCEAFDAGAWCVVVGKAITSPDWITAKYVEAIGRWHEGQARAAIESMQHAVADRADGQLVRHQARLESELIANGQPENGET